MSQPSFPTRVLAGITVPDTPTITAAIAYARAHADDLTFNHVMRSWLFGAAIAAKSPPLHAMDGEVHAVAAILHDLGWDPTGALVSPDKRFEVDGAIAARAFLLAHDDDVSSSPRWAADARRLQLVWDAVALHTSFGIAVHKEPEVAACHLGISMDFLGPDASNGGLTWAEYDGIVAAFPRLRFVKGATAILCGFCRTKPETTYDNFMGAFGERFVEGYSLEGRTAVDMFAACPLPDSH